MPVKQGTGDRAGVTFGIADTGAGNGPLPVTAAPTEQLPPAQTAVGRGPPCATDNMLTDGAAADWCTWAWKTRHRDDLYRQEQIKAGDTLCIGGPGGGNFRTFFERFNVSVPYAIVTIESDLPMTADQLRVPEARGYRAPVAWFGANLGVRGEPSMHAMPLGITQAKHEQAMLNAMEWMRTLPAERPNADRLLLNFRVDRTWRKQLWRVSESWPFADRVRSSDADVHPLKRAANKTCDDACVNEQYYRLVATYGFVACPAGAGTDTYRLWEALYLGAFLGPPMLLFFGGKPCFRLESQRSSNTANPF